MNIRARLRREDGAAAVEFALIAGVLAMLIFGMLQYGLAFFQLQNLRAATREGARIGAVGATVAQIKQNVVGASLGALAGELRRGQRVLHEQWTTWGARWPANRLPAEGDQQTTSTTGPGRRRPQATSSAEPAGHLRRRYPDVPPISLKNASISGVFRCEGN